MVTHKIRNWFASLLRSLEIMPNYIKFNLQIGDYKFVSFHSQGFFNLASHHDFQNTRKFCRTQSSSLFSRNHQWSLETPCCTITLYHVYEPCIYWFSSSTQVSFLLRNLVIIVMRNWYKRSEPSVQSYFVKVIIGNIGYILVYPLVWALLCEKLRW